jgi:membrane-associated phospholipid phosphatase
MVRFLAKAISIIMHPLFLISYVMFFIMIANPFLFGFSGPKLQGLIIISVVTISFMFPMIAILLMKALGLIKSIEMEDKLERIGPLIVTGIFFLWLYINIRRHDSIPDAFSFFVLGSTIAVFMGLLLNSFSKISLHTIGVGGFMMGMILLTILFTDALVNFPNPFGVGVIRVSQRGIIGLVIIMAGLVGSARLYLKAHTESEIYGGYIVGILSQMIAFRIYM